MTKDEALKLALDWFEKDGEPDHHPVVDAIREVLAEQPAQQEPVARFVRESDGLAFIPLHVNGLPDGALLYTSPPQRKPWVGLTPEEIDTVYRVIPPPVEHWKLSRAIETKLKEKNNGAQ